MSNNSSAQISVMICLVFFSLIIASCSNYREYERDVKIHNKTGVELMAYMVQLNPRDLRMKYSKGEHFRIYYIPPKRMITGKIMTDSYLHENYDYILLLFIADKDSIVVKDNYISNRINDPEIFSSKHIHYDPAYSKAINIDINSQKDISVRIGDD